MSGNTKVLADVGQCIYCRTTAGILQKEHIIPLGLNGEHLLLHASCNNCADITKRFEQEVLRSALHASRTALKLHTRRPRERPTHFPLTIERDGQEELIQVSADEYLAMLPLPLFMLPACLDLRPYDYGIEMPGVRFTQVAGKPAAELAETYQASAIGFQISYEIVAFARMLAKIAYGFAVAQYGLSAMRDVYIMPALLGCKDDIGRWVGRIPVQPTKVSDSFHDVAVGVIDGVIIAHVRLFAQFPETPEYTVVVGNLSEYAQVNRRLLDKVVNNRKQLTR
ncbi:MAG TPA: hypothetical protein VGD31_16965 [Sphingobacteriaceae bacterium]